MKIAACLFPLLLALAPSFANAECKPEQAHYEMTGNADWQVGFHPIPRFEGWISDLAFYVESRQNQKIFWFLFDQGSGRVTHLISTLDVREQGWAPPDPDGGPRPLGPGTINFFAFDHDLMTIDVAPTQAGEAPPYIFLPDLPEIMWYRTEPRLHAPGGAFTLKSCQ